MCSISLFSYLEVQFLLENQDIYLILSCHEFWGYEVGLIDTLDNENWIFWFLLFPEYNSAIMIFQEICTCYVTRTIILCVAQMYTTFASRTLFILALVFFWPTPLIFEIFLLPVTHISNSPYVIPALDTEPTISLSK